MEALFYKIASRCVLQDILLLLSDANSKRAVFSTAPRLNVFAVQKVFIKEKYCQFSFLRSIVQLNVFLVLDCITGFGCVLAVAGAVGAGVRGRALQ